MTYDAVRAVAESLSLPPPKFHTVADVSPLEAATAGLRDAARAKAGPSRDAQEEAVAALDAALHRAGVEDPSRREDRDLRKPRLSFDAQCTRDAATMQLVVDAYAKRAGPVVEFPQKLADIVARHADVVSWDATARKLVIVDPVRFEREVMPHYFDAAFSSFLCQLYNYGFSKVKQSATDAPRPAGALVYSNTVADLTKLVKRKSTPRPAPAPAPTRPGTARQAAMRAARAEKEQARAPSPAPAPQVQVDDDDDAASWSGPALELDEEAPPQDASVATPSAAQPVAAVAARPVGMGAAAADARVPFGGSLPALSVVVEVEAACAAAALDGALAVPAWPTPAPAPALDASAQVFGLDLDAPSLQAAAAPAPVVAAPALVSPVAAAASTKRPRDESPKSVAQSCVESYQ